MQVTETGLPVTSLIDAVKAAVTAARISSTDNDRRMRVAEVQLTLNAMATTGGGAKIEFKIPFTGMSLGLGTSVTSIDTHTINITLVPPDLTPTHEVRGADVDQVLVDAIETIGAVAEHAVGDHNPFLLKESTVELTFAITEDGAVSLGLTGNTQDEVTHKLKITMNTTI